MKSDLGLRPIYHSKDERIEPGLFASWCSCSEPGLDSGNKFRDLRSFFLVFKAKSAEIRAFRPKGDPVNVPVRRLESTG